VAGAGGQCALARGLYEDSVEILRRIGDPRGLAERLIGLGHTCLRAGDARYAQRAARQFADWLRHIATTTSVLTRRGLDQ
jgi:hypothetical protein